MGSKHICYVFTSAEKIEFWDRILHMYHVKKWRMSSDDDGGGGCTWFDSKLWFTQRKLLCHHRLVLAINISFLVWFHLLFCYIYAIKIIFLTHKKQTKSTTKKKQPCSFEIFISTLIFNSCIYKSKVFEIPKVEITIKLMHIRRHAHTHTHTHTANAAFFWWLWLRFHFSEKSINQFHFVFAIVFQSH